MTKNHVWNNGRTTYRPKRAELSKRTDGNYNAVFYDRDSRVLGQAIAPDFGTRIPVHMAWQDDTYAVVVIARA